MEPQHYETFKEALDDVVQKLADNVNALEVLKKHKGFNRLDHADQDMFETLSCVSLLDTWPSGRRHSPAKGTYKQNLYLEFESLRVRQQYKKGFTIVHKQVCRNRFNRRSNKRLSLHIFAYTELKQEFCSQTRDLRREFGDLNSSLYGPTERYTRFLNFKFGYLKGFWTTYLYRKMK